MCSLEMQVCTHVCAVYIVKANTHWVLVCARYYLKHLHEFTNLVPHSNPGDKYYYYHFPDTDKETEVHHVPVTCPKPQHC